MRPLVPLLVLLCVSTAFLEPGLGFQAAARWEFSLAAIFQGRQGALLILNGAGWFDPERHDAMGGGSAVLRSARGTLTHGPWTVLSLLQVIPSQANGARPVHRVDMLVLAPTVHPGPLVLGVQSRRPTLHGGSSLFVLNHPAFDSGQGTMILRPTPTGIDH